MDGISGKTAVAHNPKVAGSNPAPATNLISNLRVVALMPRGTVRDR